MFSCQRCWHFYWHSIQCSLLSLEHLYHEMAHISWHQEAGVTACCCPWVQYKKTQETTSVSERELSSGSGHFIDAQEAFKKREQLMAILVS